jgi:hypothetical protein
MDGEWAIPERQRTGALQKGFHASVLDCGSLLPLSANRHMPASWDQRTYDSVTVAQSPARLALPKGLSNQNRLHDLTVHIRQAEIATLELEGQFRVIDAHQMKNRSLQVMHRKRILGDAIADLIRLS